MQQPAVTVRTIYEAFAPYYDAFTARSDYDGVAASIERAATDHGLRGRTLLDMACGTGSSFMPFLRTGYRVTACDISPAMVERAAAKAPATRTLVADIRGLGRLGQFDLVTCLDDSLNYLLDRRELGAAFAGMARNLAPGGICAFDLNTLAAYRATFTSEAAFEAADVRFVWRGHGSPVARPGLVASATLDAIPLGRSSSANRVTTSHTQRHHPLGVVVELLRQSGLDCVHVYGLRDDASLDPQVRESHHAKALYLARHGRKEV